MIALKAVKSGIGNQTKNFNWPYLTIVCLCFMPFVSPAVALCIGLVFSFLGIKHKSIHHYTSKILQASIVLMGFGMSLTAVISSSKDGFLETAISVSVVMLLGILLGKLFKVEKNISLLIASGTAICGGSAIAAVAPILNSKNYENSFALIVVFVLNALALLLFPFIGHQLGLSQKTFGNWAAIAIHDTSSVVGAGAIYGEKALQVATTVKLIRALWIIPLSLIVAFVNRNGEKKSIHFPWFILLFVIAIVFANTFPVYHASYEHFSWLGKRGMLIALFLIGSNISVGEIRKSGVKSFALGIILWVVIAVGSLFLLIY
ncbi:putative sulfate exporter family transporter [Marinifilum breve]|uniref:Putative sulfate exporter family transporter n=1 Tax=Marinifilum breve TaxID=2184082 RepID=A0A2V4A1S5_9BACT|nr:putative sulfate exporter family transporter [Marinifilum breve]PXY02616.1 putative sulfate exporter family transporter [Marinifilum breve]